MSCRHSLLLLVLILSATLSQAEESADRPPQQSPVATEQTLRSVVDLRRRLGEDIRALTRELREAASETEKAGIVQQLEKLNADLKATTRNFEDIAAGVDISSLRQEEEKPFDFQAEVFSLLRPAIDEMKSMTAQMRQKSELKERIAFYRARLPVVEEALRNTAALVAVTSDEALLGALRSTAAEWEKQRAFMQSELQAAQLQLDKLLAAETSLAEASQSYFKTFFQKRGLYLGSALLVIVGVILLSRFSIRLMRSHLPGFRRKHRSFRVRLIELVHRILTLLLAIVGPMVVFYLGEDWVLFSLSVLLLIGVAWTLRQALPLYWKQIHLFLNIGSVREGERIVVDGLPWRVEQINVYCILTNPVADMSLRVPIADMVGLKSRPAAQEEPWFPCRRGDWVIVKDGNRGKVIGISPELVQLVQRGGAQLTYPTADFLAGSPLNLASNFRLKEIIGVSYGLQRDATTVIPDTLCRFIQQRLTDEGYAEQLVNLRVEFARAGSSSLDIVVIADFKGELGDLYNRLRRAIQRWCVDACTANGWEIPFPQMTLHGAVARPVVEPGPLPVQP